jgi:glycosyltransferase involved in cell wall biosynthesis
VLERFRNAAIAVAPSQWDEPLGLVVLEAMSSGCAVVTSPRGGIPELVDDAGILIDSAEPVEWAKQLLRLVNDQELRRHYQRAARARAVQCLDIHHANARLDAIRLGLLSVMAAPQA